MAESPHLFLFSKQPTVPYIAVPQTTSENRKYIPLSLMGPETVITNAMRSIPGASLYHLGVLQSRVFQVWNATVSGRLKSDTQISAEITYNNFPWPDRSTAIDGAVSTAAKGVLTARAAHPGATLADLYDPLAMPPDLTVAHKALDAAVLAAYGLKTSATDGEVLALMLSRYEQYAAPLAAGMLKKGKRRT
jgi:hypothetical protein